MLDRRLDELALPKHGTKLEKWTRAENRENGLAREGTSQAAIDAEREAGPEGRHRDAAIPMSDPREPSSTEKEVHELTHIPPQPWCEQCVKVRYATLAYGRRLKELLSESVVLERTPRHDSQANPAERAFPTLEEQVKVMRLEFEKRTGTELLANTCLWPWLVRHASWVDARFRLKTNGATPHQDAYDSTYTSEHLPFGELVLFRIPLPHTRRTHQNRTIPSGRK